MPRGLLIGWFFGMIGSFCIGLMLSVMSGVGHMSNDDFASFWAGALTMYAISIFCFRRMRRRTFDSWLSYLVMPSVRLVCMIVVLSCWAMWALGPSSRNDEEAFAIAIVLFGIVWVLSWMGPWLWRKAIPPALPPIPAPPRRPPITERRRPRWGRRWGRRGPRWSRPCTPRVTPSATRCNAVRDARGQPAPAYAAPAPPRRERRRRQGRGLIGGAAGMLAGLLLFAGFTIATLLAFDLPDDAVGRRARPVGGARRSRPACSAGASRTGPGSCAA